MKQRVNLTIDDKILKEWRENFPNKKLSQFLTECLKADNFNYYLHNMKNGE